MKANDNNLKVRLQNQGNVHVNVSEFAFYLPSADNPIAGEVGATYILAGQTREWLLKANKTITTAQLRLKADTDVGKIDILLPAE